MYSDETRECLHPYLNYQITKTNAKIQNSHLCHLLLDRVILSFNLGIVSLFFSLESPSKMRRCSGKYKWRAEMRGGERDINRHREGLNEREGVSDSHPPTLLRI